MTASFRKLSALNSKPTDQTRPSPQGQPTEPQNGLERPNHRSHLQTDSTSQLQSKPPNDMSDSPSSSQPIQANNPKIRKDHTQECSHKPAHGPPFSPDHQSPNQVHQKDHSTHHSAANQSQITESIQKQNLQPNPNRPIPRYGKSTKQTRSNSNRQFLLKTNFSKPTLRTKEFSSNLRTKDDSQQIVVQGPLSCV